MTTKTTNNDFEDFKKYCIEFQELIGITNFNLYFQHTSLPNEFAKTKISYQGHVAMITLNTTWPDRLVNEEELRKTALHEMVHVLILPLSFVGSCRWASSEELEETEEELTVKLSHLLTKLLYAKKV